MTECAIGHTPTVASFESRTSPHVSGLSNGYAASHSDLSDILLHVSIRLRGIDAEVYSKFIYSDILLSIPQC
jgi:hypothetical protein